MCIPGHFVWSVEVAGHNQPWPLCLNLTPWQPSALVFPTPFPLGMFVNSFQCDWKHWTFAITSITLGAETKDIINSMLMKICYFLTASLAVFLFLFSVSCSDSLSVCSGVRPGLNLCEIGQLHSIETDMWHGRLASCKTIHILIPPLPCLPRLIPTLPSTISSRHSLIVAVCWHFSPTRFGSSLFFFFWKFPQRAIFDQVHFS